MMTFEEFKQFCYKWLNPVADDKYMKRKYNEYKRENGTSKPKNLYWKL